MNFKLKAEVVSVIQDTGFPGSAEEYVHKYYRKEFDELTVCEAEMIILMFKDKPGILVPKEEKNHAA